MASSFTNIEDSQISLTNGANIQMPEQIDTKCLIKKNDGVPHSMPNLNLAPSILHLDLDEIKSQDNFKVKSKIARKSKSRKGSLKKSNEFSPESVMLIKSLFLA